MPNLRQSYSYATLAISDVAFEEIREKLIEAGVENDYIQKDRREVIVFGTVGLIKDENPIR